MFYITEEDWDKIHAWAQLAYNEDKNEISGLMLAIPNKDEDAWILKSPDILKQVNSGVNTTLDGDAITNWVFEKKSQLKDKPHKYVWWHSHHMMSASWSGTDDNEIEQWKNDNFTISLLINLKGDHKLRVSYWNPVEHHVDTEVVVIRKSACITKEMKKQYKELCSNEVSTIRHNSNQGLLWNRDQKAVEKTFEITSYFQNAMIDLDVMKDNLDNSLCTIADWKALCKSKNKEFASNHAPFKISAKYYNKNNKALAKTLDEHIDIEDMFDFSDDKVEAMCKDYYGGFYNGYYQ